MHKLGDIDANSPVEEIIKNANEAFDKKDYQSCRNLFEN